VCVCVCVCIGAGCEHQYIAKQLLRDRAIRRQERKAFFFSFSSLKVQVLSVKTCGVVGRCMGSLQTNLYAFEIPNTARRCDVSIKCRRFGRHISLTK